MVYSFSATSLPPRCALIKYPKNHNSRQSVTTIKAHDQGSRSNNSIVDANLSVLRERMEGIKVKERLEKCCRVHDIYGWNYIADSKRKPGLLRQNPLKELLELSLIICGTLGFTVFSGTFFLCLISLLVHLNQSL